jgi:hemin uptake protein HemP
LFYIEIFSYGTCKSVLTPLLRIIIICIMIKPSEKAETFLRNPPVAEGAAPRKRVSSRELFGAVREVVIDHVGEEYRLRITSQGKLILTK